MGQPTAILDSEIQQKTTENKHQQLISTYQHCVSVSGKDGNRKILDENVAESNASWRMTEAY